MHYESGDIVLSKELLKNFFKKRTSEVSVYKIFSGIEGNRGIDLENIKYEKCTISFHFSNHEDMVGEITKYLEYKPTGGRNIVSYMKTMMKFLIEERDMKDSGYFCVVV